ncbi:hypothetical protein CC79DRAFT_1273534 [Sarocladium strictum]
MSELAGFEEERKAYQEQLDLVGSQLKGDPENVELQALHEELNSLVAMLDESIAELKPKHTPKAPTKQPSPPPEPEKWSRENHPAFKKAAQNQQPEEKEEAPVTYNVNDMVQAKWLSGDKGFYPARITSITGSSTAPIYIVKFKGYDNTETLRARDVRPFSNKRKADSQAAPSSSTSTPNMASQSAPGLVSSAGATMYPEAKTTPGDGADPSKPPKAKKIKAKKELERGKSKWQEFNSKSKFGKAQKKDSMFRTPDGVNARVGFTGSGQAMRKDPTRSRHVYEMNEELD